MYDDSKTNKKINDHDPQDDDILVDEDLKSQADDTVMSQPEEH